MVEVLGLLALAATGEEYSGGLTVVRIAAVAKAAMAQEQKAQDEQAVVSSH